MIVDFSLFDKREKKLFHCAEVTGKSVETVVNHINPYLVDAPDLFIEPRTVLVCDVPKMNFGNMPADGGELLFDADDRKQFLIDEPEASAWIRPYIGAKEFINSIKRYCLWLTDIKPDELKKLKRVYDRVKNVKKYGSSPPAPILRIRPIFSRKLPSQKERILFLFLFLFCGFHRNAGAMSNGFE